LKDIFEEIRLFNESVSFLPTIPLKNYGLKVIGKRREVLLSNKLLTDS